MLETKVVNIKYVQINTFKNSVNSVYVDEGKWSNPYVNEEDSIIKYINMIYQTKLVADIHELYGKNLGTLSTENSDGLDRPLNHAQALADILNKCLYTFVTKQLFSTVNNKVLLDKVFFNKKPSKTLLSRVFLIMLPKYLCDQAFEEAKTLPFLYNHVAGDPRYSPRRGVCVQNNTKKFFTRGSWTLTKNKSNCTIQMETVIMKHGLKNLVPFITTMAEKCFPDSFHRKESNFGLFVANKYNKGQDQVINPHTDDEEWYPSPAIFGSITFFPENSPKNPANTFRFQVKDPESGQWIDMYLPHGSVCLMCANLEHRVSKPLGNIDKSVSRINLTFRNLLNPHTDPLGYLVGISNHYRYYGIPSQAIIPKDVYQAQTENIEDILDKYRDLNPMMTVTLGQDNELRKRRKKQVRDEIIKIYDTNNLELNVNISKANIVLELLQDGLNFLKKYY